MLAVKDFAVVYSLFDDFARGTLSTMSSADLSFSLMKL
jgi:hypothetical protein